MPALQTLSMNVTSGHSTVIKTEELSFACPNCGLKFTQNDTLKRHQLFYCKPEENGSDSVPTSTTTPKDESRILNKTPNATISSSTSLQNLLNATSNLNLPNFADAVAALVYQQQQQAQQQQQLLLQQQLQQQQQAISNVLGVGAQTNMVILPVAYHNQSDTSIIQVVGPAQTIIPVAISRTVPVSSRSLLLDSTFASQLQLPGKFPLNPASGEFGLPLAFSHQIGSQMGPSTSNNNVTATATILSGTELNLGRKRMRTSSSSSSSKRYCDSAESSSRPLDLSKKTGGKEDDAHSDKANGEAKKPFACDCGVSFMSKETLTSHRKYYCKNRVSLDEIEEMEPARKVPSRCSQCDYVPATHAQLAQHIRHKHSLVQAFVCLLCGYKGYSARGIKNHLRTSHGDEMSKRRADNESNMLSDKSLLQDYVFCVTADTKQLQCEKCRLTFPTDDLMKRHQCRAAEN